MVHEHSFAQSVWVPNALKALKRARSGTTTKSTAQQHTTKQYQNARSASQHHSKQPNFDAAALSASQVCGSTGDVSSGADGEPCSDFNETLFVEVGGEACIKPGGLPDAPQYTHDTSRRALALTVTTQLTRYRNKVNFGLAVQVWV